MAGMGILEWLGQIFSELFPPWDLVPKTHVGVRQRNLPLPHFLKTLCNRVSFLPDDGIFVKMCGPGFVFKIPFIDEVWHLPVTFESEDLENIDAETHDGLKYQISPVLTWKVWNPLKACFAISNYESSLKNEVRAVIVRWVNAQTGRLDVQRMERECSAKVQEIDNDWGCKAQRVSFNSCSQPWQHQEIVHRLGGEA